MRCGVCRSALAVRGYRSAPTAGGARRVPLYQPCPGLSDPTLHPARARREDRPRRAGDARSVVANGPVPASASPVAPPFERGARLSFVGTGPFAGRIAAGALVVIRTTCGTRSIFEGAGHRGAIWPDHAAHWRVVAIRETS